jgi:acetylornithine deacetylase/succinyl-diaminopimelate desuccinylase-like protein
VGISFGFHPSLDETTARTRIEGLLAQLPEPWTPQNVVVRYEGIHNGAYVGRVDALVARRLRAAVRSTGALVRERRAWCVSCDARLYHELLGVPTVVFGAGRLEDAHSSHEHLAMDEWARGTLALAGLLAEGAGDMDAHLDTGDR